MHIALMLEKQNLIRQRNALELSQLKNSASCRSMLNDFSFGNLDSAMAFETSLNLENIYTQTQLMAINAELDALNQTGSRLNYQA